MEASVKLWSVAALLFVTTQAAAFSFKQGHPLLEVGAFFTQQGEAQNIGIQDLIGDHFTVTDGSDTNAFVGLGYLFDGPEYDVFSLAYGLNAFYFPKTTVKGDIVQEQMFTNLAYHYDVTNLPVYAMTKLSFKNKYDDYLVTVDLGIGPNFIKTLDYSETSLGSGTIPDNAFSGDLTTAFSAMAGIGIKKNNIFRAISLECGYRFFYFGQGEFDKKTDQILDNLETGNSYAQAIVFTLSV